ncbi:uncharacterized protein ACR2FA_010159 [Aphomia sociella]
MWITVACVLTCVYGGGGVTKQPGITKFWTDDYNVFEQVYGKTSDKDLYGATLPPSFNFGRNTNMKTASEKKEILFEDFNADFPSQIDTQNFADRYAKIFQKQLLDYDKPANVQPAKSSINFVSYTDFKPIRQESDPETYNYLKHLENADNVQNIEYPKGVGGFKPYLSTGPDPEQTQAYKNIQDILDAHENNNPKVNEAVDDVNYLNYPRPKNKKKTNPRYIQSNELNMPRCSSGRCRKRTTNYVRRTRPYVRKIKHRIINY